MRVCFIIDRLAGVTGGAERMLCLIASALARRGHAVEVVTADPADAAPAPFYPLDARVRRITLERPPGAAARLAQRLVNLLHRTGLTRTWAGSAVAWAIRRRPLHRRMRAHLTASRPDVAIAFMRGAIGLAGHGGPPRPARGIAALRNVPAEELDLDHDRQFLFQRWIGIRAVRHFDRITVQLPEYVADLPADLRPRARVIPNPVALPDRPPPAAGRAALVVAVSRLVPQKRIDALIDAWAAVAPAHPGWRLEIYGDGPERAALAARIDRLGIAGSARLMGVTDAIGAVYARARLMVHPSAFEGFPNAVAEALAHGVPVTGFADCPGLNGLVRDDVNGRLVPAAADRAGALAAALGALLADPGMLDRLGAAGPGTMTPYGEAAVIDRWEALLAELAGPARP